MSFWGDQKWRDSQHKAWIVSDFDGQHLQDGCYRLSVGNEAIVSVGHSESESAHRRLRNDSVLALKPGQFAYLITQELVHVPAKAIAFINMATSIKIKGLVNISGFHADPGYKGKLIFTVFNSGPSTINITPGERLFRIWLSDFEGSGNHSATSYDRIPPAWAERLQGTYPSPFSLATRVNELENKVQEIMSQRRTLILGLFFAGILLLPFIASLYANMYSAVQGHLLEWIKH